MERHEIEKNAREIAKDTVNKVLHCDDKALEEKVNRYAQESINVLVRC